MWAQYRRYESLFGTWLAMRVSKICLFKINIFYAFYYFYMIMM